MQLFHVLLGFCYAAGLRQPTNPIQKVLQLLDDLTKKVVLDGEIEKKQYEKFTEWCEDSAAAKQYEIKNGKAKIEDLQAVIEKETATASNQESTIADLATKVATNERELNAATEIRDKEHADFVVKDKDLEETVDMLGRAIGILAKSMKGASFAQVPTDFKELADAISAVVKSHTLGTNDEQALNALLQQPDDDFLARSAPDAKAYESHSSSIIDTLEDLKDKAVEMREETIKAEMNAKHAYELLAQSLKRELKVDGKALDEAKLIQSNALEQKSRAEGDLAMTQQVVNDAETVLSAISSDCQTKSADFQQSQAGRAAELQALAEAKRIIGEKTGSAADRAYGMIQTDTWSRGPSKIVQELRQVGATNKDVAMTQLALRVEAAMQMGATSADVFAKVRGMIQEMIDKLISQAAEEADHKAWCDKEMGTTQAKIEDHQSSVEELGGKIDQAEASIAQLKESIAETERALAEIAKQQAQMNTNRAEEKEAFAKAKSDYQAGIEGLTMALQILREFYAAQAEPVSPALMQTKHKQPTVGSHEAASGDASGIIGLLEVAQADFSKLLADAEAEEAAAQEQYDNVSKKNAVDTATKQADVKYEKKEMSGLEKSLADLKQDRQGEQAELDAVTDYYSKVRPGCETKPLTYEERKQRRESEIAGLKEALSILESESMTAAEGGMSFLQRW